MLKFKITTDPTFSHPVEVFVPVDGGHAKQTFRATFGVLPSDQERQFDLQTAEGSDGFLRAIVRSLDDLVDEKDEAVPYSDALRDQLLQLPYVRQALVRTYYAGIQKGPAGN